MSRETCVCCGGAMEPGRSLVCASCATTTWPRLEHAAVAVIRAAWERPPVAELFEAWLNYSGSRWWEDRELVAETEDGDRGMAVYGPYADDGPIAIVSHATLRRGLAAILCAEPARFADIATGAWDASDVDAAIYLAVTSRLLARTCTNGACAV